jgi:hypothetical protein
MLSHFSSFPCRPVHLHRCLESGTEKPLIRRGISIFISVLNFLNSLRNQSDQTVLTPNRPSCLIPSPFSIAPKHDYHWIPLSFYSRLNTCLHTFDDLYFHSALLHLPSLCPSLCLSVSWLPSSQSLNNPMTLKAFRGNRFEFVLEIFTLNSRRFCHDLPTRRTGASSLPPSA